MGIWPKIAFPKCIVKHGVNRTNQINSSEVKTTGMFPVVDQGQKFIAGYTDDESKLACYGLPYVIFGDHTRCFKYVDFPFVIGADGTKVLKPDPTAFDAHFFFYAMLTFDIPSRGYNRHFKLVKEKLVPKPPFPEQRRIAAVLSLVQGAIEQQERLIALTTELKKALMHKLFTEGTRGEPQKQTEIGPVPESWIETTLGELCKKPDGRIQTGPFGSMLHKNEYQNKGIPVVNPVDLDNNRINRHNIPCISNATANRLKRYRLKHNDILFARRGEIGRHGIVFKGEKDWICGTGCFIVRISSNKVGVKFLNCYFSHIPVVSWLERHAAGVIMLNLSNTVLSGVPIYLPKIKEQVKIANTIEQMDKKVSNHKSKFKLLQDLFRTLLHQLMTAEIRVNDLDLEKLRLDSEKIEKHQDV